ncbi:MAG: hypothetical protein FJ011_03275 [Chloroflexi bacterium]|nr:hypothetical protein [Chloroflexota bacterium]
MTGRTALLFALFAPWRELFIRRPTGRLRALACMAQPGQAGAAAGMGNRPPRSSPLQGGCRTLPQFP